MVREIVASAPGKVNLHLGVGEARTDGYHDLVSVFHAVDRREVVRLLLDGDPVAGPAVESMHTTFFVDEPDEDIDGPNNLAWRAVEAVVARAGVAVPRVRIEVDKHVFVAGGMAGGSADAAAALLACSALWETGHTRAELAELAAPLGADVPFSVLGGAAVGLGTGAELTPVAARTPVHLVLVPADAGLSTPVVFQTLDELRREGHLSDGPTRPEMNEAVLRALTAADPLELATAMDNDLQTPAVVLFPELSDVLDLGMDEGALRGMVSGSGPTLLFVAQDEASALRLASAIEERTGVRALPVHGPVPGAHVL